MDLELTKLLFHDNQKYHRLQLVFHRYRSSVVLNIRQKTLPVISSMERQIQQVESLLEPVDTYHISQQLILIQKMLLYCDFNLNTNKEKFFFFYTKYFISKILF